MRQYTGLRSLAAKNGEFVYAFVVEVTGVASGLPDNRWMPSGGLLVVSNSAAPRMHVDKEIHRRLASDTFFTKQNVDMILLKEWSIIINYVLISFLGG